MGEIEDVRSRFQQLVDMQSGKSTFASQIGLSRPDNVNNFYNGKTNNLSIAIITGISSRYPDFNFNWLFKGEEPIFHTNNDEINEDIQMNFRSISDYQAKYFEALEEIRWLVQRIRECKNKLIEHGIK